MVLSEMLDRLTTLLGRKFRCWTKFADVQQFYCFEVLSEMLDRLTTSANIVCSAHAQLAKERQTRLQSSQCRCFLGLVSFVSTIAFQQSIISYTLIMDNITKYNKFYPKEEASSVNEETVAQRSYKKAH